VTLPAIVDAVESLLDASIARHSNGDETFVECLVCGDWEGHQAGCFVPALLAWQETPDTDSTSSAGL
jgi:hypothetical protein